MPLQMSVDMRRGTPDRPAPTDAPDVPDTAPPSSPQWACGMVLMSDEGLPRERRPRTRFISCWPADAAPAPPGPFPWASMRPSHLVAREGALTEMDIASPRGQAGKETVGILRALWWAGISTRRHLRPELELLKRVGVMVWRKDEVTLPVTALAHVVMARDGAHFSMHSR